MGLNLRKSRKSKLQGMNPPRRNPPKKRKLPLPRKNLSRSNQLKRNPRRNKPSRKKRRGRPEPPVRKGPNKKRRGGNRRRYKVITVVKRHKCVNANCTLMMSKDRPTDRITSIFFLISWTPYKICRKFSVDSCINYY